MNTAIDEPVYILYLNMIIFCGMVIIQTLEAFCLELLSIRHDFSPEFDSPSFRLE
jgi:hypothetical protein